MPDVLWDDVKDYFGPETEGCLPDVFVQGTNAGDCQAFLGLIPARGWWSEYSEGGVVMPLPGAGQVLSRPSDAECPQLRVRPVPGMEAIFRFLPDEEIDFDVDLRELRGQERLDLLCDFLRTIGSHLGKPVVMTPEGMYNRAILGYDVEAGRVVFLAGRRIA
ncbi:hypothetical protein I5Q34_24945 [Streptomyces sp. AV19]|uniref:hypothetical protein n=1 Tax=Streptomyces sp. AV19 TaxID=2793068 RepID=UPI0018FEC8BD|nr:hypothetical protein [Streptomyces sp. AV19]MBH1937478.1 hypothetical protein [Streptomyces sp. AV19]MDG4533749.1 hypothetical protein [Streptomyces sp. AV19]